jgi:hypothetical protein
LELKFYEMNLLKKLLFMGSLKELKVLIVVLVFSSTAFAQFEENSTHKAYTIGKAIFHGNGATGNSWIRGGIGQNIRWNNNAGSAGAWEVSFGGSTYSDFALLNFGNGGTFNFYTRPGTGSPYELSNSDLSQYLRLFIGNNGQVGVGTSSPSAKFDVKSSGTIGRVFDPTNAYLNITNGSSSLIMDPNEIYGSHELILGFEPNKFFEVTTVHEGTYAPLMRLKGNGNLGIGITEPQARLELSGDNLAVGKPMLAINHTAVAGAANPNELQNSRPFVIRRHSNDAESYSAFLSDNSMNFVYQNDEVLNAINFRMINTDTESGGGARHNDNIVMSIRGGEDGGRVGIGTTRPEYGYRLSVDGKIKTKEIKVTMEGWSDFVFADDYVLPPLAEVEAFIQANKHLPSIPSEAEVLENGINLGEMDAKLLQKIEELTLYMIEQNAKTEQLLEKVKELEQENQTLKEKMENLAAQK